MSVALLLALLALTGAEDQEFARSQLQAGLQAHAEGRGEAANTALAQLSDARETRLTLGLDLVEAWWRVGHQERAINTLSKWRQEAPRSPDPLVRARARALSGSPFDLDAFWPSFVGPDASPKSLCRLLSVARSLDAVGQRDVGQRLLERAWSQGECEDAEAQRAAWERPRGASNSPATPVLPRVRRHVLGPGHESKVVKIMVEQPGELAEGAGLIDLRVPERFVEGRYGPLGAIARDCEDAPLCVTLHHPSVAQPGDRLVGPFALRVGGRGALDADALIKGLSARISAQDAWDPWRIVSDPVSTAPSPGPRGELTPEQRVDAPLDEATSPRRWGPLGLGLLGLLALVFWLRGRAKVHG